MVSDEVVHLAFSWLYLRLNYMFFECRFDMFFEKQVP